MPSIELIRPSNIFLKTLSLIGIIIVDVVSIFLFYKAYLSSDIGEHMIFAFLAIFLILPVLILSIVSMYEISKTKE